MFLHVKIKKGKFIKNLPTCAKLVYLFVLFFSYFFFFCEGGGICDRMVIGFQIPMQSVFITSEVVSSNTSNGEVYFIQPVA
jgi:hypothetical protein